MLEFSSHLFVPSFIWSSEPRTYQMHLKDLKSVPRSTVVKPIRKPGRNDKDIFLDVKEDMETFNF